MAGPSEFDILRASAAGMDAQRSALDLAARNVAAAQADTGSQGFARLVPRFAVAPGPFDPSSPDAYEPPDMDAELGGETDASQLPVRYLGAVPQRGVNADAVTEMVAVLDAQRAYEANASIFDSGKRLMERTIDLERL